MLTILDLSWNSIGEAGAIEFAQAIPQNNSLVSLNLAANGLSDAGGQRFMDSVGLHGKLQEINLSQNGLSDGTCFVVAQVVHRHPTMRKLDLSLNPLGEAGARSIFRNILRGQVCFVVMRNCSYKDDVRIYNHTYPSMANPYTLDLSEPYKRCIVLELLQKFAEDPVHCSFGDVYYREQPKSPETSLSLAVATNPRDRQKNIVVLKNGNQQEAWEVPRTGVLRLSFLQSVFVPTLEHQVDAKALNILCLIVEHGQTDQDKKMWLALLCQDLHFTTSQVQSISSCSHFFPNYLYLALFIIGSQAQGMIDRFKKKKTIGDGGLTVMDIVVSLWKFLIDTEHMFDFLCVNLDVSKRRDFIYGKMI